jgi:hypothetical protein
LDLPDKKNQDIIKDEIIVLNSNKAIEIDVKEHKLSLVPVYEEDKIRLSK